MAEENTVKDMMAKKGLLRATAPEVVPEVQNENKTPLERNRERPEPFSEQEGLDSYESVDEINKKNEEMVLKRELKPEKPKKVIKVKEETEDGKQAYIKSIPMSVMKIAKSAFPILAQAEAVTAYIVAMSDDDIPEDIDEKTYKAIVEYRKEMDARDSLKIMAGAMKLLNKKLVAEEKRSKTLELGMAYLLADRLGFRQGDVSSIDNMDFTEDAVLKLLRKYRSESLKYIFKEAQKDGRPIK